MRRIANDRASATITTVDRTVSARRLDRAAALTAGDRLIVTDLEGGQVCEIVVLGPDGRSDPSLLGTSDATEPDGLKAILASDEESAVRVRKALADRKWTVTSAQLIWKAKNPVTLDDAKRAEVVSFLEALDEDDDVQNLYVGLA